MLLLTAALLAIAGSGHAQTQFSEDFSSYEEGRCVPDGASFGPWTSQFNGYGCVKVEGDGTNKWVHLHTAVSASPQETHAALVSGPSFAAPLTFSGRIATVEQLRTGGPASPWETGWLIWNYADNAHFYYFIPKPNGWEVGKRDPAYPGGQRFLASGVEPVTPIGAWASVTVTHDADNRISVSMNGRFLMSFTDAERPYAAGKIGVYVEDSHAHFDDIAVTAGGRGRGRKPSK